MKTYGARQASRMGPVCAGAKRVTPTLKLWHPRNVCRGADIDHATMMTWHNTQNGFSTHA